MFQKEYEWNKIWYILYNIDIEFIINIVVISISIKTTTTIVTNIYFSVDVKKIKNKK